MLENCEVVMMVGQKNKILRIVSVDLILTEHVTWTLILGEVGVLNTFCDSAQPRIRFQAGS